MMTHLWLFMVSWNMAVQTSDASRDGNLARAVFLMFGCLIILFVFSAMWYVSVMLSDPMGTDTTDYDLMFDLAKLWRETKANVYAGYPERFHKGIVEAEISMLAEEAAEADADGGEGEGEGEGEGKKGWGW